MVEKFETLTNVIGRVATGDLSIIAKKALKLLEPERPSAGIDTNGSWQSSVEVANLYKFRVEAGIIKNPNKIEGLFESIKALSADDVHVQMQVVDLSSFVITVWLTEEMRVCGLMLLQRRLKGELTL